VQVLFEYSKKKSHFCSSAFFILLIPSAKSTTLLKHPTEKLRVVA